MDNSGQENKTYNKLYCHVIQYAIDVILLHSNYSIYQYVIISTLHNVEFGVKELVIFYHI